MIVIGVLTPHAEPGPEVELPEMAPGPVDVRLVRIPPTGVPGPPPTAPPGLRELAAPAVLDEAAGVLLAGGPVDVLVHASTSTGYALGPRGDAAMLDRLAGRWGVPVVGAAASVAPVLRELGVRRVALVHPPWFSAELNALGAEYLGDQGFDAVPSRALGLPHDPARVEPGAVVAEVSGLVGDDSDAVVIGGTGFRASRAVAPLQERLGRPVLHANQLLLRAALAAVGGTD